MSDKPRCERCRYWDAERVRGLTVHGSLDWQARCLEDPSLASPPLCWWWHSCAKFAPELRPHNKEAA